MNISFSDWVITVDNGNISLHNEKISRHIWLGWPSFEELIKNYPDCGDDPAKCLKAYFKDQIKRDALGLQLGEWCGQQIKLEDNLDYIEIEAKKRGLV